MVMVLLVWVPAWADCPPGDFNGDCRVDAADLAVLARQWLAPAVTGAGGTAEQADLNGDGRVNGADLAVFAGSWRARSCPVVINEVLAHAHAEASDWIELYNTANIPVPLGGWFLSDNRNDLQRYEIAPGTTIGPHGYLVLYEILHFGNPLDPGLRKSFAFSENGDSACLYAGDDAVFPGTLVEQPFGASRTGQPFGRHRTSLGRYDFVTMSVPTPGAANAYPRVGPVVINEIMYRPYPADNDDAEYVELLNIAAGPVTLFDPEAGEPWRLTDEATIDLWLPAEPPVTLAPGESLLLVRSPASTQQYEIPAGVRRVAWNAGRLASACGSLRLLQPGDTDERGTRYWIEVERVDYSDGAHGHNFPGGVDPWPVQADGYGFSLSRRLPARYGNDPNNWLPTIPSPGAAGH